MILSKVRGGILGCGLAAAAASAALAGPPAGDARQGYVPAPPGSETLTAPMDPVSIHMFADSGFAGTKAMLSGVDTTIPPGYLNELPKGLPDAMSSLRWNLPRGVVVVLYENSDARGEQLILWGTGEVADLKKWEFNDKASRWAWFDVGGAAPTAQSEAARLIPFGAEPLGAAVTDNTLQLFKDDKFMGDMQQVTPVTSVPAGQLQKVPGNLDDKLTSVRWTLPEGVVVIFYEDADGEKARVAIWGKAQLTSLARWDFNDKISRWSWTYVGATEGG